MSTMRSFSNPVTRVLVLALLAASVVACATKPPVEPVALIKKG